MTEKYSDDELRIALEKIKSERRAQKVNSVIMERELSKTLKLIKRLEKKYEDYANGG